MRYRIKLTQQALPGRRLHARLPSYQLSSASNVFNVIPGMASDNGPVGELCGATWLVEGAWGSAAGWSPFQRYGSVAVAACCGTEGEACRELDGGGSTCCPGPDPEPWSDKNLACTAYRPSFLPDGNTPESQRLVCTGKPVSPGQQRADPQATPS